MGVGLDTLTRELVMIQNAGYRWVGLLPDVNREFESIERRWREKLKRHFANYGIRGATMPPEHFNSEGRHPTGGKNSKDVQLFAFKAFQHRLYGVTVPIQGTETFVGLKLITDKKTNRADQALLRRVAQLFQPYQD